MAYLLFKYVRGKLRERKVAKLAEEGHPMLDVNLQHGRHGRAGNSDVPVDTINATPPISPEEHARIKAEARRNTIRRWKLIIGLLLPNFLAAVDVTIVAPAVPVISSHFNKLSGSFNWIVAAYTLTFTTFVPVSGQIADIFGRHAALHFNMFFIMIGSAFCAAATTWGMLLFGRALQGIGAAGVMNISRIVLSDGMSLADTSKNNTIFAFLGGISYAVGPVVGGYLAQASWRYCFVVAIPIAFLAHILIFFLMRKELVKGRVFANPGDSRRVGYMTGLSVFDWPGMVLFIFGTGLIILAGMWGGNQYKWSSAAVVAPLVMGGLMSIGFFLHEYLLGPGRLMTRIFPNQVAMIPSVLFRRSDTTLLLIINFATGISLVSAFYFISIYWELAEGYPASRAGVQLLFYTPGLGAGVYSAMFLCNVWPRQTFFPLFWGSAIETVGLALLAWAVSIRHRTLVNGMLALAGAGTGLRFMPVVLHAAGIWPSRTSAMQSIISFMIPFGETIGISVMAAVFTDKFNMYLRSIVVGAGQQGFGGSGPPSMNILNDLPDDIKLAVQNSAAKAVMWSFISILPFMALSVVAAALLGNVWIGKLGKPAKEGKPARPEVKGTVMYKAYLLAVATGNVEHWRKELDKDELDVDYLKVRSKVADIEQEPAGHDDVEYKGAAETNGPR